MQRWRFVPQWHAWGRWLVCLLSIIAGQAAAATYGYAPTAFAWIDNAAHTDVVWTGAAGGPAAECTGGYAATDDDITQQLNIGFAFPFGSSAYTQVRVMSNGRLQFNNNRYCYYGTQTVGPPPTYTLPYPNANLNTTLRIYGADFCPAGGGSGCAGRVTYATLGTAPYRSFVVTWSQMKEWNSGPSLFNLQIILYENGDFVYQYRDIANQTQGTGQVGWQLNTTDYDLVDMTTINSLAYSALRFFKPTAPIAEYRFDECSGAASVLDASGNSLNGTPLGTYSAGATGTVCRAGAFNGTNAYVAVPNNALLNQPYVSVAAWVRHSTAALKNWEAILAKGDSTYRLHLNGGCSINSITTAKAFTFGFNGGCGNADLNSGVVPVAGQWYHVVGTYDGATIKVFVNGELKNSQALTTTIGSNTYPLYLGENSQQTGRKWSGDIDEIKIFDRALPDSEVLSMYVNESQGLERSGTLRSCLPCATSLGGFNIFESSTPAGSINGMIKTKVAGTQFANSTGNLDVVALNAARTAVDTTYSASNVRFELLDASNETGSPDANGCYAGTTTILAPSTNLSVSGGRSSITASLLNVANVYPRVRVRAFAPPVNPSRIGCSSDVFAIRPAYLDASALSARDTDYQSAGTTRQLTNLAATGGNVHAAGKPFTVSSLAAKNAGNVTTSNYQGQPTLVPGNLVLPDPAACPGCVLGTFNVTSWTANSGVLSTDSASYSEAGSFSWEAEDRIFAAVDFYDSKKSERYFRTNALIYAGRFVPNDYRLQLNTPLFQTFGGSCATRSFTYLGQPFGYATAPLVTVTAQNATGGTTVNFRTSGGLWTLKTPLASSSNACTAPTQTCALQRQDAAAKTRLTATYSYTSSGATPGWDGGQLVVGNATLVSAENGAGQLTLPAGDKLALLRPAAPPPPFTANISVALQLDDFAEAGVAGNPAQISGALAAAPVAFDAGNAFRHGRLRLINYIGSELLRPRVEYRAEYWDGSRWTTNAADNCTSLVAGNIATGGLTVNALSALANGVGFVTFNTAGVGSYDIAANLNASGSDTSCNAAHGGTAANRPWLQGFWSGSCGATPAWQQDPNARVRLGSPKTPLIYLREQY